MSGIYTIDKQEEEQQKLQLGFPLLRTIPEPQYRQGVEAFEEEHKIISVRK
ncbi:hypothetical protein RvY_01243 [Ramazzottius varieornatus]|uniref:Uncharacterized protein n=1 Tax=Ramazzottius varieornatus TaxID=947166 RepID=A0A1D1ULP2_RAMVA|nr:hypothetical protein RvY_01243 [Ramazzottius varieornatus]